MSYRINPDGYCTEPGCTRPKATGEEVCSQCARLARTVGRSGPLGAEDVRQTSPAAEDVRPSSPAADEFLVDEAKPPRCIAYLSIAGDVITLELTSEPKFTQADIEAVAELLSNRKQAS